MKRCCRCGVIKPLAEFSRDKSVKDGRERRCKACSRIAGRAYTKRHPERLRAYRRANRERHREYSRKWRAANRDKDREYSRQARLRDPDMHRRYYEAHKEENLAQAREWIRANPEKSREIRRKSEARRRAVKRNTAIEEIQPSVVFERDKGTCGICGGPVDPNEWHLDHVVPLAMGGPHTYANVQVAHPSCNRSKGARLAA